MKGNTTLRDITFYGIKAQNRNDIDIMFEIANDKINKLKDDILSLAISNPKEITPANKDVISFIQDKIQHLMVNLDDAFWEKARIYMIKIATEDDEYNIPIQSLPQDLQKEYYEFCDRFSEKVRDANINF